MRHARVAYRGGVHAAIVADDAQSLRLDDDRSVAVSEVTWLPPVDPGTIVALGLNYADHASELALERPAEPLVFLKTRSTLLGHLGVTSRPADAQHMHYECELVVVMGKTARNVPRERAYEYVRGYTIANDYAIREYLENYYRPNLRVKNRDACTPLGPWIVDRDDIRDPMTLELSTRVNGRIVQAGNTRDMLFDIPALIAYLTSFMTLAQDDLILTGTPRGVVYLEHGDLVSTEIEGIGALVNTIVDEPRS